MKRLALAAAVLIVVYLWWSGAFTELADAQRIRTLVHDAGPAGPVLFFLVLLVLFPVFLAGVPIWLSSTLWPMPEAILYSGIGSLLIGLPFFLIARHWGREWAQDRIPESVRRWEDRLEQRPLVAVVGLRLFLWINPAVDLLIGVSHVTTRDYLLGTAAALVPLTVFHVTVGAKGMEWASQAPDWLWIALAATGVAFLGFRALRARTSPRADDGNRLESPPEP